MVRFNGFLIASLVGGFLSALPAAAQSGNGTSSLTHVVSVTIAPRVKVKVSALSLSPRNVPAAVQVTAAQSTNGLALTINANQAWVLAIKSGSRVGASSPSRLQWSNDPSGRFAPVSAADSRLAAGTGSADTTVVFRDGRRGVASKTEQAVILTVSAP